MLNKDKEGKKRIQKHGLTPGLRLNELLLAFLEGQNLLKFENIQALP
jgi:hypothetical protein